jgi:hypothetical protein
LWGKKGEDILGDVSWDLTGFSVSMSNNGNTVAIGAIYAQTGSNQFTGRVRIYDYNGEWEQRGLGIPGDESWDLAGWSVSMDNSGNTVAIGAILNSDSMYNAGHVRIYKWNDTSDGFWEPKGGQIVGESEEDFAGISISMSNDGNIIAIGAPFNDNLNANPSDNWSDDAGHVRIYEWNSNSWTQIGMEISGKTQKNYSGYRVSMNGDGNTVAIVGGVEEEDQINNSTDYGHVRIYRRTPWSEIYQLIISGSSENTHYLKYDTNKSYNNWNNWQIKNSEDVWESFDLSPLSTPSAFIAKIKETPDYFLVNVPDDKYQNNVLTVTVNGLSFKWKTPNSAPSGTLTISGTAQEGQQLIAIANLNDEDELGTIHYQWKRDGEDITDASAQTYTLVQADVGSVITVTVSYTDGGGTAESVTSTAEVNLSYVFDVSSGYGRIDGKYWRISNDSSNYKEIVYVNQNSIYMLFSSYWQTYYFNEELSLVDAGIKAGQSTLSLVWASNVTWTTDKDPIESTSNVVWRFGSRAAAEDGKTNNDPINLGINLL